MSFQFFDLFFPEMGKKITEEEEEKWTIFIYKINKQPLKKVSLFM